MRSKSNETNNTTGQPHILGTGLQGAMSNSLHNLNSFGQNRAPYYKQTATAAKPEIHTNNLLKPEIMHNTGMQKP
jgi:hypothetical protein